ncbi:MAG: AIR synthase related protein [Candidatus Daviesbacteria bacterium]|nr:AIR synthase related protein [Candidatus Daviesbacteria bacterium]
MKKITYSQVGDNYQTKDPINKLFQSAALKTAGNLKKLGFNEVSSSRGESCFVWKQGNIYMASVIECLGTKNLIADEMRKITGKTYYDVIAQDTVATFINDLSTSGAKPLVVHAYWGVEDNSFLQDEERTKDFISGWTNACQIAGTTWGGGETATSKGIIEKGTINLAGSCVGIIKSEKRLLMEKKLQQGDRILLIKSNGVNANGISLTRALARKLPKGYATKLTSGKYYGEALLTKSNIYAKLIQDLLDAKLDLHYITNITGHGMRKIMRSKRNFTYVLGKIFAPQEIFQFIQKCANLNDYEMYQTFNMGQDYAIFLPERDIKKALRIVKINGFEGLEAGYIKSGKRKVIIEPKNITLEGETLDLR